jgi:hypothetical protein
MHLAISDGEIQVDYPAELASSLTPRHRANTAHRDRKFERYPGVITVERDDVFDTMFAPRLPIAQRKDSDFIAWI